MARSTDASLKAQIKRHRHHMEKMKASKELKGQDCQALKEHLKLVEQALQKIEEKGESQGAHMDVRVLIATFENMQM